MSQLTFADLQVRQINQDFAVQDGSLYGDFEVHGYSSADYQEELEHLIAQHDAYIEWAREAWGA